MLIISKTTFNKELIKLIESQCQLYDKYIYIYICILIKNIKFVKQNFITNISAPL